MGEIEISSFRNLTLLEKVACELPAQGIVEEHFDHDRYCEGCETQANSDTDCPLTNSDTDKIDQPLDEFHIVENDPSINSNAAAKERINGFHSSPLDVNATSTDFEDCLGKSFSGGDEINRGGQNVVGVAEGERGCCFLEPRPAVETSSLGIKEECCDFLSLSPLRTLVTDELVGASGIGSVVEGGCIDVFFYESRDCKVCEDSVLESPGMETDCSLLNSTTKQIDGFLCPTPHEDSAVASTNFGTNLMDERCGNFFISGKEPEKRTCSSGDSNTCCLDDNKMEENQLFSSGIADRLCLDNLGPHSKQKEADACGPSEEMDTALQVASEEERCGASFIERASCSLMQGLPDTEAPCFAGEQLASAQSSHLLNTVEDCPLKLPSGPHNQRGDGIGVDDAPSFSSSAADSYEQADNVGKINLKSSSNFVSRRTNPKRAASSRKPPCDGKPDQLTRKKSAAGKSRKAGDRSASLSRSTIRISLKSVTKKRSCSHKVPRASVWGEVGNLLEIFELNYGISKCGSEFLHIQNKESKKTRRSGGGRSRPAAQKAGSSRGSRTKRASRTNPACLKNQGGHQPMIPVEVDSLASIHIDLNDSFPSSHCQTDLGVSNRVAEAEQKLEVDGCSVAQLSSHCSNLKNQILSLERDAQHGDKDLESSVTQETSVENTMGSLPGISSRDGHGALIEPGDWRHLLDPGTSPDSDVLHPTTDIGIITNEVATSTSLEHSLAAGITDQNVFALESGIQGSLHDGEVFVSVSLMNMQHGCPRKGNKSVKVEGSPHLSPDHFSQDINLHGLVNLKKARKPRRCSGPERRRRDGSDTGNSSTIKTTEKASKCKEFSVELSVLGMAEQGFCQETLKMEYCMENCALSGQDVGTTQIEVTVPGGPSSTVNAKGHKLSKCSKAGARKCQSSAHDSAKPRRRNAHGQKNDVHNSVDKRKTKDMEHLGQAIRHDVLPEERGSFSGFSSGIEKNLISSGSAESSSRTTAGSKVASEDVLNSVMAPESDHFTSKKSNHGLEGQCLPPRAAWVRCDDCHKWRCIPAELVDIIDETNCRWTCKDNNDKAFADCSIPQEKTNAEINAELEISDASCEEGSCSAQPKPKGSEHMKLAASQRASWTRVKYNLFLHRSRKTQTIDEIMVCHCKPPLDGSLGCGDDCLNRMLNIECVRGTCPCEDLCSNQQFQKRIYAKFKWFRCGKKGFGLQLLQDVSQGAFLIEYVGEVLDLATYEGRQRDYASKGQKHFYFMTLNGSEVIDACAKGNLGRFINHSCEPNCRTEKWMVNGEVCIGLFAVRDIKKGEEVTFDYNYVRVFGAAAKKCVCGSAECRGYIGGDPLNTEVIVQGDSDEEYPEPVMVLEDGEQELDMEDMIPDIIGVTAVQHEETSVQITETMSKSSPAIWELEIPSQNEDSIHRSSTDQPENSSQTSEPLSKSISDPVIDVKLISDTVENKPHASKSHPLATSSRSSGSIKKSRCNVSKLVRPKAKKMIAGGRNGRFEGVEEKLNELLDADGGISKRKDATKGYLKLLLVTAASGDNVESEAIQSTRDLSLILDALLKTKSRIILMDIINKNGLQMLHNIMKQNQRNINKIPIIRKLLKVLEFFALKEILTPEHISTCPPRAGVESLKESIIKLTYHNDIQVHQIARNFRDKWMPRAIRKVLSDRHVGLDSQHANCNWFSQSSKRRCYDQCVRNTDTIYCANQTTHLPSSSIDSGTPSDISSIPSQQGSNWAPSTDTNLATGTRTHKRKSRWDQPSDNANSDRQSPRYIEDPTVETSSQFKKPAPAKAEGDLQPEVPNQISESKAEENGSYDGAASTNILRPDDIDEEVPPGFASPVNHPHQPKVPSSTSGKVVIGHPQERYLSQLTVSYGIPLALVKQLGTCEAEAGVSQCPSWIIAPGVPFHPFPPLPSFPRHKPNYTPDHGKMVQEAREEAQLSGLYPAACHSDPSVPSVSGERSADGIETGAIHLQTAERVRWSSDANGKRFFRPQKWNDRVCQRYGPPWPRERIDNRFRGSMRNGMSRVGVGNSRKEVSGGFCISQGLGGEDVSSTPLSSMNNHSITNVSI